MGAGLLRAWLLDGAGLLGKGAWYRSVGGATGWGRGYGTGAGLWAGLWSGGRVYGVEPWLWGWGRGY